MELTPEIIAKELKKDFDRQREIHLEKLSQAREAEVVARVFLQNEARRLEQKLGKDHPRTQQLEDQLQANMQRIRTLDVEHEVARIRVSNLAEGGALLHGRVKDENDRGLTGLTVFAENETGKTLRVFGRTETDASGYYAFPLDAACLIQLSDEAQEGVYLVISNRDDTHIHRRENPIHLTEGARVVIEIILNRADLIPRRRSGAPVVCSLEGPDQIVVSEEAPYTVAVNASAMQPVDFKWAFGDGATASGRSVTHRYIDAGTYTVTVTVSNNAGSDTAMATVIVTEDDDQEDDTPPDEAPDEDVVPSDVWIVEGQVCRGDEGVEGLVVSLYDNDLLFDDVLGTTVTGPDGTFRVLYRTEAFRKLLEQKPDLYLKVIDQHGETLYTSKHTVRAQTGHREVFAIDLP